jgi:hypothetical protein
MLDISDIPRLVPDGVSAELVEGDHRARRTTRARPSAPTSRRPTIATSGCRCNSSTSRSTACGGTIVSLFNSEVRPCAGANADIGCAGKPEVGSGLDQPHVGVAACGVSAAVGGRVVDDDDLVRNGRWCSVKRGEAAFEILARVEADDDDRNFYQD